MQHVNKGGICFSGFAFKASFRWKHRITTDYDSYEHTDSGEKGPLRINQATHELTARFHKILSPLPPPPSMGGLSLSCLRVCGCQLAKRQGTIFRLSLSK